MNTTPHTTSSQLSVTECLRLPTPGRVPFSVEFMPPRTDQAERQIWNASEFFHDLGASFTAVTYGAGGSSRDRTVRVAQRLIKKPLTTLLHLTLVDHTREELVEIIKEYARLGLTNILALRGDPPGDPLGRWTPRSDGLNYASELIELIASIPEAQDFNIGIASFPEGHYRARDLASDTHYTLEKLRAGAEYSITQMFFDVEDYLRLRDRLSAADPTHGEKPIIPGLMPITSLRSLHRQVELAGGEIPRGILSRMDRAMRESKDKPGSEADIVRETGIEITTAMAERLIAEGVPDLHFMTLNQIRPCQEILHNLGMAPAWGLGLGQDGIR